MAVLALVTGCGGGTPTASQQATATQDRPDTTISQFDPWWMSLKTPPSWTESDRAITGEFQQFGLRPVDETEMPRNCNRCGVQPPTAFLTAYTPADSIRLPCALVSRSASTPTATGSSLPQRNQ